MKIRIAFVVLSLFVGHALAETENFDGLKSGRMLPRGWRGGVTGEGKAKWTLESDRTAPSPHNVLKQSGAATYCWCVKTNISIANGSVEVKFKPIEGKEDQAGGLIWRFQDGDNYYIARANALGDNVTIYQTVNGVRTQFQRINLKVAPNEWHTLRVEFRGPNFQVSFDGQRALNWKDETFKRGGVGVWTKADSVTLFDDFKFEEEK